jgi:hypothetical protein
MREIQQNQQLFLGLRLVCRIFEENQQSAIQTKKEEHFGRFFQQIKVRQPNGRKDSKQTVIPTSRRLDSFLYEAAQNFDSSQIFNIKNKSKNIAVDVLFKAYPMLPLSG